MILNSPSAQRNAEPIFDVLSAQLAILQERLQGAEGGEGRKEDKEDSGGLRVLELASGPGNHVELFAGRLPDVYWQPSEPQADGRASIDARVARAGLTNVAPALALDARKPWPQEHFALVLAVNLVHISAWEVTEALVAGAAAALTSGGTLMLYGPYKRGGAHTSQGNIDFDADLRRRDPSWGIRNMEDVAALGRTAGLCSLRILEMPANNLCLLLSADSR